MEFWTHIKTKCSCSLDSKDLSQKTVLWVCLLKSVDTRTSGHTTKVRHQRTHRLEQREQELYGHICFKPLDTWTFGHTAKNISLVYSERFFLKKHYWYVCLNQWTHGLLDTQQNNVYLYCTQWICHKKLYGYVCFKSMDAWTTGHTEK